MVSQNPECIKGHQRLDENNDSRLTVFFRVEFFDDGIEYTGQLTNLSSEGAHMLMTDHLQGPSDMLIGKKLRLRVLTTYGESACIATVVWLNSHVNPVSIGIEFDKLAQHPEDPLRCAMDSPL